MSAVITHVRFRGVHAHEAIIALKWRLETGLVGDSDVATMIDWMDEGNAAVVADGRDKVPVAVVRASGVRPFLRSYAGEQWTDHLVTLPTF